MKRKLLYILTILICFIPYLSVNAEEPTKVAEYIIQCNDLSNLKGHSTTIRATTGTSSIEVWKENDKYILRISNQNFPTTKPSNSATSYPHIYDMSGFRPTVCGISFNFGTNIGHVVYDYLVQDIELLAKGQNIYVATLKDDVEHIYFFTSVSSRLQLVTKKPIFGEAYTEYHYNLNGTDLIFNDHFTINGTLVEEPKPTDDELFTCYYKHEGNWGTDNISIIYNITKDKFSFEGYAYPEKIHKDIIIGEPADSIKKGECPREIKLCHPSQDGIFMDTCANKVEYYKFVNTDFNGTEVEIGKFLSSVEYKKVLGGVKNPLSALAPQALDYELTIDGSASNLNAVNATDAVCKEGECSEPKYQTETAMRYVKAYCNELRKLDPNKYASVSFNDRYEECNSFDAFYDRLVEEGIISDLVSGCGFISPELKQKLNWILNIIKIAGPIIAIVLGMLDFTKVLAAGDPDKGMKDAWKRFQTRLIAAVILFLVPILLSIPLDIIIGDKLEDDPFCNVID